MEGEIISRFWTALIKDVSEDRSGEIHVSDLLYECIRRAWYSKRIGEVISDPQGLIAVWVGRKLHEMPICDEHEVPVKYTTVDGVEVIGRIDELCKDGDGYFILDKKTTRQIPNRPYDHHIKQTLFYAFMLQKMRGVKVNKIGILYIDVSNLEIKSYVVPVNNAMIEQAGKELELKAKILYETLKNDKPPNRQIGWWCNYCSMFRRCFSE